MTLGLSGPGPRDEARTLSPPRRTRVPCASCTTTVNRERACSRPWRAWSPTTSHIAAHATPEGEAGPGTTADDVADDAEPPCTCADERAVEDGGARTGELDTVTGGGVGGRGGVGAGGFLAVTAADAGLAAAEGGAVGGTLAELGLDGGFVAGVAPRGVAAGEGL